MRQSNQPAEQNDNNKNNDGRFLLKAVGDAAIQIVFNGKDRERG